MAILGHGDGSFVPFLLRKWDKRTVPVSQIVGVAKNVYLCIAMAGVYVHIPFCSSRCSYCDFFSTLRLREVGERYVDAVVAEARLRRGELRDELFLHLSYKI